MDNRQVDRVKEFLQVAYEGDIKLFEGIVSQLSLDQLNAADKIDGKTALILAAERGNLLKVEVLIKAGADLNILSMSGIGYTALMYAIKQKHRHVVGALFKAKAKINLKNMCGQTAFDLAKKTKDIEILKLFEAHYCPLINAAKIGAINSFRALMPDYDLSELNCVTNMYDENVLIIAARLGHLEIVKCLIDAKVDLNKISFEGAGYTALMMAIKKGHVSVVEVLLQAKAEVSIVNSEKESVSSLLEKSTCKSQLLPLLNHYCIQSLMQETASPKNANTLMQTLNYFTENITSWVPPVTFSTTEIEDGFEEVNIVSVKSAPRKASFKPQT